MEWMRCNTWEKRQNDLTFYFYFYILIRRTMKSFTFFYCVRSLFDTIPAGNRQADTWQFDYLFIDGKEQHVVLS